MGWASYEEDILSRLNGASPSPGTPGRVAVDNAKAEPAMGRQGESKMNKLKDFTITSARPLPVIILADTSGSMSQDGKIEALNTALSDMIAAFAEEKEGRAEIQLAIITFGEAAQLHNDLTPATNLSLAPLRAYGRTPMGAAFDCARELIEDRARIPSRAYSPAIVLVSDGQPTDGTAWEEALSRLLSADRAKKAQRFALGIGADADVAVLRRFLANPESKVYGAADARQIRNFFNFVTMSVTTRSRSMTPNASLTLNLPPSDLDELL